MKKFLVSTADVYGYNSDDTLLFVGKTLLDSSIETTLGNTDVRAGRGNQLQYIYYHTAEMNITINEAQFSLEFLALNTGVTPQTGADMFIEETVNVSNGSGSVEGTPLSLNTGSIYGWVTTSEGEVLRATFTGSTFTIPGSDYTGTACMRYYSNVSSARSVTIYADMLPSTIRLVMEAQLCSSDSTTNQIGIVQIIVPRASMTGAFTLSMTPDAVSQTPLSVRALATTKENVGGCTGQKSYYAEIIERLYNTSWYDNVIALAIEGGDLSLVEGDNKKLTVYAIPGNGGAAFLAPSSDITISTSDAEGTHVSLAGDTITAVSATTTPVTVSATINSKPEVDANIFVTVTAK